MESVLADPSHIIVLNSRELRGALKGRRSSPVIGTVRLFNRVVAGVGNCLRDIISSMRLWSLKPLPIGSSAYDVDL
jgi:hypothetical protein